MNNLFLKVITQGDNLPEGVKASAMKEFRKKPIENDKRISNLIRSRGGDEQEWEAASKFLKDFISPEEMSLQKIEETLRQNGNTFTKDILNKNPSIYFTDGLIYLLVRYLLFFFSPPIMNLGYIPIISFGHILCINRFSWCYSREIS